MLFDILGIIGTSVVVYLLIDTGKKIYSIVSDDSDDDDDYPYGIS